MATVEQNPIGIVEGWEKKPTIVEDTLYYPSSSCDSLQGSFALELRVVLNKHDFLFVACCLFYTKQIKNY